MRQVFLITIRKNFLQLFVIVLVFALLGTGSLVQHRITLPVVSVDRTVDAFIVVDPGLRHVGTDCWVIGGNDCSARDLVLDIARKLQGQLEKGGLGVRLITETGDMDFSETNTQDTDMEMAEDIEERIRLINHVKPDIVLSLHTGYSTNPAYFGAQVLYRTDDGRGKLLAESIQRQFAEHLGQDNRRARPIDDFAFKGIEATLVLVEIGVLSNPTEKRLLQSNRYRERLAYAIRCGVESYLSECKILDHCSANNFLL